MSALDFIALAGAGAITVAFSLARFAEVAFVVPSVAVLLGAALWVAWQGSGSPEAILLVAGLALYAFGLGIVRVMLHRSVSLRMLARFRAGQAAEESRADIVGRLRDIEHFRLVAKQGEMYRLTAFGQLIAGTVGLLYRMTKLDT